MPDYAISWQLSAIITGILVLSLYLKTKIEIGKRKKIQMDLLKDQKELENIVKIRTNDLVELNQELNKNKKERNVELNGVMKNYRNREDETLFMDLTNTN